MNVSHKLLRVLKTTDRMLTERQSEMYWTVLRGVIQPHATSFPDYAAAVKSRDFVRLLDCAERLSSQSYEDAQSHYCAVQLVALVRKFPYPGAEKIFEPERVAFETFMKSEARCRRINKLFALRSSLGRDGEDSIALQKAREWIQYVIGTAPDLRKIWEGCYFGPGASIGVHGNATNAGRKISAPKWSVTPGAFTYFYAATMSNLFMRQALLPTHGGYSSGCPSTDFNQFLDRVVVVNHNKVEFVPKTVKVSRPIAVEPLGNGFIQGGVSKVMRLRLKRIGLDLSDQTRNQQLAREGSLDDSPEGFVTIDLASASDSISIGLCRSLLPPEWFSFLDDIRSKTFVYKDDTFIYEKFCSMGNGFCFPLQTLLFAALCHASNAGEPGIDFRVYGDDIIVRKHVLQKLLHLLHMCGFQLNRKKTHVSGPFRESCGANWFGGVDVTAYTWDELPGKVTAIYKFLNATQTKPLWAEFFEPVRAIVLRTLKHDIQLWRPFIGAPDTGLNAYGGEHLSSSNCTYLKNGLWRWHEIASRAKEDHGDLLTRGKFEIPLKLYAALRGLPSTKPYTLRRETKTTVIQVCHGGATSQWLPPLPR